MMTITRIKKKNKKKIINNKKEKIKKPKQQQQQKPIAKQKQIVIVKEKEKDKNKMHSLTEFCQDIETNGELVRCCSCQNTLSMSGAYEIRTIPNKIIPFLPDATVEGMICERCIAEGRIVEKAIVITGENDDHCVTYVPMDDLAPAPAPEVPSPVEDETVDAIRS